MLHARASFLEAKSQTAAAQVVCSSCVLCHDDENLEKDESLD